MPDTILQKNITISSAQDTGVQIKLKDETSKTYSFFKNKKDGGVTQAFEQFGHYKVGDRTGISYKEVPYKDGMIKNIIGFTPLMQETAKPEAPKSVKENSYSSPAMGVPRNYDKEAYEKCSSIWLAAELGKGNDHLGTTEARLDHFYIESMEARLNRYWAYFQAIRADGEKRFATGWDKAVKTFTEPLPEPPPGLNLEDNIEVYYGAKKEPEDIGF